MSARDYVLGVCRRYGSARSQCLHRSRIGWRGLARGTTVAHRRFRLHSWRSYIRLEDCESKGARLTGGVRDPAGESKLQKVPCGCSGRLNALRSVILWLVDQRLYVVCLHLFRWERGEHSSDVRRPGTKSIPCEDVRISRARVLPARNSRTDTRLMATASRF